MRANERTGRRTNSEPDWRDLNYMIYESEKMRLPKDLSPREYEEAVKKLAIKYNL